MVPLLLCARCGECSLWLAMEAKFMNCSGSRSRLLRLASYGLAGALLAAGCGGSGTTPTDAKKADGGDGGAGTAMLMLGPSTSQDFGSVAVGSMSAPFVFTISNKVGTTGQPTVSSLPSDFVVDNKCTQAIPANGSCMISVTFKPGSTGAKSAMLSVSATPGGMVSASLSGTGITAGSLNITPASKDFMAVAVGDTSPATT